MLREAHEIDRDVDLMPAKKVGNVPIAFVANVHEVFECGLYSLPHR